MIETHDHSFGQDRQRPGERRTLLVIVISGTMMVVEITAGVLFGSMALLADGLHMASHAVALAIAAFAYIYARRRAHDKRFSFGTGKVNALGGFAGAMLLAMFAVMMAWESLGRFIHPVAIQFNQAILVAVLGFLVNGVSAVILAGGDRHVHDHGGHAHQHHDHNLRSAYLHVLADALTSVLAIAALLSGKFFGLNWMDPCMGIVGSVLVARWSVGLVRGTARVLLDRQAAPEMLSAVRACFDGQAEVTDLHLWSIAPGQYAAIISLCSDAPQTPAAYKSRLPGELGLAHVTIEVNPTSG